MTEVLERLDEWELRALEGDFSKIPQPFSWQRSARFAHFLDGYREAGGMNPLARLALTAAEEARNTGAWRGNVRDLWLCLFFEHRAARHCGSYEAEPKLDALCEALRTALQALDTREALDWSSRLKAS